MSPSYDTSMRREYAPSEHAEKIEHACELLRTERYTVTQIAELCNFSDVYYFSRQFKAHMGITPTQFVRKYRSSK